MRASEQNIWLQIKVISKPRRGHGAERGCWALTFPPDYQRIPSSSSDFPEPSACCGFSAGSSSKPSLQACQGDETHGRRKEGEKKSVSEKEESWGGGAQLGYVVMCVWQRECVKIRERVCVSSSCTLERGNLLGRFTPSLARSFFSSSLSTSSCRECWGLCLACEADGQMDRIFQLKQFTPEKSLEWASS